MNKAYNNMTEFEQAAYRRAKHEAYFKAVRHRKQAELELYPNLGIVEDNEPKTISFGKLNHLLPAAKELLKRWINKEMPPALQKELKNLIEASEPKTKIVPSGIYNNLKVYHHSFLEV